MLIRRCKMLLPFCVRLCSRKTLVILALTSVCVAVVLASFSHTKLESYRQTGAGLSDDDEMDAALERAALESLGAEDGTIIVMDAQTGRLRAVVNPQTAFTESYAPGSAIKPFTALAALRLHLIDERTRQLCHTRYTYKDLSITCAHQKTENAFNLAQALGYSCNYFFAKVGERLETNTFDETLSSFGFGAKTGVNEKEATGSLPQGEWRVSNALGESKQLLVTPVQLITAYTALVNGGHLFVPQQVTERDFQKRERAQLTIAPEHRALLIEGMKGAVSYGTAQSAGLTALPFEVFGKTGTSAMMNDYHSQGWFVGFAAESASGEIPAPDKIKLAVLVFMKHASGAQCARLSRSIFEEYARLRRGVVKDERVASETPKPLSSSASLSNSSIRIHLTSRNITREVSLEEYVLGVVTAEGSLEDELESLKALAVVSRTYALHNLQRHASEGYDFCDTTHCQRYLFTPANERATSRLKNLFERAVKETAGQTLLDDQGQIADAYFHAACGGMTANMETLWGVTAPSYLKGVTDEYCTSREAAHEWVNVIPAEKLAKALRTDAQSDVGARLENITITSRDRTGRAEFLTLDGETSRTIRGWDFKMIVGRALGWNVIKSSRFDVVRVGANFIFRGTGFGHGLGLCQEGAHALARRGATYLQILSHYFPGTSVRGNLQSGAPSDK